MLKVFRETTWQERFLYLMIAVQILGPLVAGVLRQ